MMRMTTEETGGGALMLLKRTILLLAVAALMAAMMAASAMPAFAGVKGGTHEFSGKGQGCGFGGNSLQNSNLHARGASNHNPHVTNPCFR